MGQLTRDTSLIFRQLFGRAATEQGGVLSGDNPTHYNPNDPLRLWVIQAILIIAMTQLLSVGLSRMRQPRVIAEVIAGVILGPTVMGRIPHFKETIFPDASMPLLNLTATIGLVVFLFLVGLEIDTKVIKRNMFASATISAAGLLIPLGLGAALGVGVYKEFINPNVNFGYFLLFTAVAVGITAFPVLCRILTELKLLETTVGVVTLSAGVGNDVIGWILLALTVALINASSGLTALWVLLASTGYVILLLYPGRWAFVWLCKRTGSLEQGSPTTSMMTITLLVLFVSAFFTDIIGVHAIFGGFLTGLIVPHDNGFAISLVEKLEDLVSILFLPIYFTLSGLRTNLGLLNTGKSWGYTILICAVAFTSKFVACGVTAIFTGFNWRESGAIGALMSCKGLVELIVLNIGLQAGILDTRVFSMFVVHALILTFITTPLTLAFYPPQHRTRETGTEGTLEDSRSDVKIPGGYDDNIKERISFVLDKIEQVPAAMTMTEMLKPDHSQDEKYPIINIDALRLIELSSRTSAVLKSRDAEALMLNDPVLTVFRTFGHLNRIPVSPTLSVVTHDDYPIAVSEHASKSGSNLVIIPWSNLTQAHTDSTFDGLFHRTVSSDHTSTMVYTEFVRKVFMQTHTDVALYVDRGMSGSITSDTKRHLFLPFFGGPDDRLAMAFIVQLCMNPNVTATVVRIRKLDELSPTTTVVEPQAVQTIHNTIAAADTVYGQHTTQTRIASDTADNITWDKYALGSVTTKAELTALSRIKFESQSSSLPLHTVTDLVNCMPKTSNSNFMVVVGRSRRMAVLNLQAELRQLVGERGSSIGSSVTKTLGFVGAGMVAANVNASLLVMQSYAATS
ncbi:hypothetical protein AMATHDRAFT_61597 [Amanita thiersii Skay4041]|uniref:Cation/H+ exchanger transmembrane domain-containing protein n=1 Tax=Amanita thiersii Skay4041 TaxID=703135 RepID=A0A2A9NR04_9AGAR|nr:hypothetical protein AMATHDRAFT_61597 [Amanita thiersii Skay4041]